MDREGVNALTQRFGHQPVDLPVALDQADPFEPIRNDDDLEVGLGAGGHAVPVALVDDFENLGTKTVDDGVVDSRCHGGRHGRVSERVSATTSATSITAIVVSFSKCFIPSVNIVLQNGQATSTTSALERMTASVRLRFTRFSSSSSIHI